MRFNIVVLIVTSPFLGVQCHRDGQHIQKREPAPFAQAAGTTSSIRTTSAAANPSVSTRTSTLSTGPSSSTTPRTTTTSTSSRIISTSSSTSTTRPTTGNSSASSSTTVNTTTRTSTQSSGSSSTLTSRTTLATASTAMTTSTRTVSVTLSSTSSVRTSTTSSASTRSTTSSTITSSASANVSGTNPPPTLSTLSTRTSTTRTGPCATITGVYALQASNTGDETVDSKYAKLVLNSGDGYKLAFSSTDRQSASRFEIEGDCSLVTADGSRLAMVGNTADLHYVYFYPSVQRAAAQTLTNWEAFVCQMNADNTLTCTGMQQSVFQITPGEQFLQIGDQNYGYYVTVNMINLPRSIFLRSTDFVQGGDLTG